MHITDKEAAVGRRSLELIHPQGVISPQWFHRRFPGQDTVYVRFYRMWELAQEPGARQPHVIIHRQAPMATPENTWAALKQAVLWGADQTVTLVRLKK